MIKLFLDSSCFEGLDMAEIEEVSGEGRGLSLAQEN
jgi:hypothetical protein